MKTFYLFKSQIKISIKLSFFFLSFFFSQAIFSQSLWSDPATWSSGMVPILNEDVEIEAGMHVILDTHTPDLGALTINGILEFADQDLNLTADYIMVMGEFLVGSEATPYTHQATITLNATDPNENIMGMGTRGIMVMGGRLELHGQAPTIPWTKINAHAPAGATSLSLMENPGWNVNDEIVIAPTDYYDETGVLYSQKVNLTAINGTQLTIDNGLNAFRWGLIQYATNSGMSLSNANLVTPPAASGFTPTELDQRAPVGNLTRNIVVQAPEDALWTNDGFGVHIMVMRFGAGMVMCGVTPGCARLNGVEIRRGGQRNRLGRYPFHWHMLSYEGNQTLPDATGQYIRNSSVNTSSNRGIVIHGTNGVEVSNNVIYDINGHGIFLEDGVERRNTIDGNLVLHVRNTFDVLNYPTLKEHEEGSFFSRGASCFWLSNPDNTVINNTAADSGTNGFWMAFPDTIFGASSLVPMKPSRILFGTFDNNTSHSHLMEGIMLDFVEVNETGEVFPHQYVSTTDGQDPSWPWATLSRFNLTRYKTWKNGSKGIWDRGVWATNFEVVSADNCGRYFAGSGADGIIERSLVVGTSLNHMMNGLDRPLHTGEVEPAAFATYHSAFDIYDNIVIDFPPVGNTMSGAFATNDYYIRPVEKGQIRNTNNLVINSHPGVKLEADFPYFALAGALWDPNGAWGGTPGDWLVYDQPFFTYGQIPTVIAPGSATTGGVLVEGPFYGFNEFVINQANIRWEDYMEIHVERLDEAFSTVGTWTVEEAQQGWPLAHMRHFAAHYDDYYQLEFPTIPEVNDVGISVSNMITTDDDLVVAIEYSGNYTIDQVYTSTYWDYMAAGHTTAPTYANKHVYTPVASRQAVLDSSGETYWQDTANDLVWIKIQGGIQQTWDPASYAPHSDELLYWLFYLRVWGSQNPLPVELISFHADLKDNRKVEINWETASETQNELFTVQRSADGEQWEDLVFVEGAGNSSELLKYAVMDENPLFGTSYYRLKQMDINGKISFSEMEAIHFEQDVFVSLSPNPAGDFIYLKLKEYRTAIEVAINDAKGKNVFFQKFDNLQDLELDISNFNSGVYFVKVKSGGGLNVLKMVKE